MLRIAESRVRTPNVSENLRLPWTDLTFKKSDLEAVSSDQCRQQDALRMASPKLKRKETPSKHPERKMCASSEKAPRVSRSESPLVGPGVTRGITGNTVRQSLESPASKRARVSHELSWWKSAKSSSTLSSSLFWTPDPNHCRSETPSLLCTHCVEGFLPCYSWTNSRSFQWFRQQLRAGRIAVTVLLLHTVMDSNLIPSGPTESLRHIGLLDSN
jgi:hypothetical protein